MTDGRRVHERAADRMAGFLDNFETPPEAKTDGGSEQDAVDAARQRVEARRQGRVQQAREKLQRAQEKHLERVAKDNEGISVDKFVDGREKSRNEKVAERAHRATRIRPPIEASLEAVGDPAVVSEMARAGGAQHEGLALSGVSLGGMDASAPLLSFGEGEEVGGGDPLGVGVSGWDSGEESGDESEGDELSFDDPFGVGTGGGGLL